MFTPPPQLFSLSGFVCGSGSGRVVSSLPEPPVSDSYVLFFTRKWNHAASQILAYENPSRIRSVTASAPYEQTNKATGFGCVGRDLVQTPTSISPSHHDSVLFRVHHVLAEGLICWNFLIWYFFRLMYGVSRS